MATNIVEVANAQCQRQLGSGGGKSARVLFVDDEERILRALRSLFRLDYDVRVTTDGRLAAEMLRQEHFDLIVSDQRMPEIQGIEVLRTAREVSPDTVRVLLTGFADLAAIMGSVNEGEVFRYISKPWDNEELFESIARAVNVGVDLRNAAQTDADSHSTARVQSPSVSEKINVLFVERRGQLMHEFGSDDVAGLHAMWAATPDAALDIMQQHEVSIVVAAIDGEDKVNIEFLNILKVEYPHIVLMVVAKAADSAMLINLINTARVFRVTFRPLKPGICQIYLRAALKQVIRFRNAPALVKTQQTNGKAGTVPLLTSIGQRLLSIKSFFSKQ